MIAPGWLGGLTRGLDMRLALIAMALLLATGCASGGGLAHNGGARPPQGPGPGGTDFGYWNRDQEGAVDASFRRFIVSHYKAGDEARARPLLEKDGFNCVPGSQRVDATAVPDLECTRLYKLNDDVHAWTVEFYANGREPHARYTRTHIRDRMQTYDDRKHH
jgi:hypothetical protein